jgi:hypothetical protein
VFTRKPRGSTNPQRADRKKFPKRISKLQV